MDADPGRVADRALFGLGASDIKCLDLARAEPDLTAGRIAGVTGLSAAAVTALLDRLERAGFIERVRGTDDRRKVHVRSTGRHEAAVNALYGEVAQGFAAVAAGLSDEQVRAYIAVQGAFNRAALDVAKSIGSAGGGVQV
ncbi:MarR family transcriptional regulator [Catenulispora pinisilvae]|uniref:MarR family transcriptional regulator n=1 Tax=Catenulispora pinisilvae TaxID=2705253 RepID=UPI002B2742AD|nr:MarR family transcriptional regulator [Catenulispora pinisilvae]